MPHQLPCVLSSVDLPLAELTAARLDGELFGIDRCFSPVDEIEQPLHRVRALRAGIHDRLIAEQLTAAWVWGALTDPPAHHQFCAALASRVSRTAVGWRTVREVVVDPAELATIGGMQVTMPLRTTVDIARFSTRFSDTEARAISGLLLMARLSVNDAMRHIEGRRNLPNKKRALARLAGVHAINVVHGVDAPYRVEHAIEVGGIAHFENESTEGKALARR